MNTSANEDDRELSALMVEYQAGSLEAFQAIYVRLSPQLRRYLQHLARGSDAADDLLQETFLQLHRSRAGFNPAYAVRPWVFGLARNVFLILARDRRTSIGASERRPSGSC
jgi:RNA polymerase sigma-70 factor (ECF subfamily)